MKFLDAKRARSTIENKMGTGPSADKSEPSSPATAPAVSGSSAEPKRPKSTPAAARLAEELGVDLSEVKGSGIEGFIVVSDVRSAAESKSPGTSSE